MEWMCGRGIEKLDLEWIILGSERMDLLHNRILTKEGMAINGTAWLEYILYRMR